MSSMIIKEAQDRSSDVDVHAVETQKHIKC